MNSGLLKIGALLSAALCVCGYAVADCGSLCVCATDATCAGESGCDAGTADCAGTAFTIDCFSGAVVKFELYLDCADCEHCIACASIVNHSTGGTVSIIQAGCDNLGCNTTPVTLTLSAGSYKIYACLRRCTGDTCEDCSGCTAKARVYRYSSDCGTSCTW